MLDILGMVRSLKRPGLLVRAARFGQDEYRRDRALRRILKSDKLPRSGEALILLMEIENLLNEQRTENSANYNAGQHIAVLTAMMGETRILRNTRPQLASTT